MSDLTPQVDETGFLGGRLRLRQRLDGYRAGLDAALLAAALDLSPGDRALELGCGVGAALLSAALRCPEAAFVGIERDADAAELAEENTRANRLCGQVRIVRADALSWKQERDVDAVFLNPPWYPPGVIREPPKARRGAWISEDGVAAWIHAGLRALRPKGALTLIHRADALADVLGALAPRAGGIVVRPVQPRAEASATRIVVRAIKTGRAPLSLAPALILHPDDGSSSRYGGQAEAILRGEAGLAMTG